LIATSFHQNASPGGSLKEHGLKLVNTKRVSKQCLRLL